MFQSTRVVRGPPLSAKVAAGLSGVLTPQDYATMDADSAGEESSSSSSSHSDNDDNN